MKEILRKNRGITLIALVITILVMLMLAGVAINAIVGEGSIIGNAEKTVGMYNNSVGNEQNNLNELSDYLDEYVKIPATMVVDGKTVEITSANAKDYYGKTVNYTPIADTDVGWKIFYVSSPDDEIEGDTKGHIYLIADNCVEVSNLPATEEGNTPNTSSSYERAAYFTNVYEDYNGSEDITDERLKALNSSYFNDNNFTSTYDNMKSVAYMMDTEIWNENFSDSTDNTGFADYVIGGPTIELYFKSYNLKYNDKNGIVRAVNDGSSSGYEVSLDGIDYEGYYLDWESNDTLYVPNKMGAHGYWLASCSLSTRYCDLKSYGLWCVTGDLEGVMIGINFYSSPNLWR